MDGFYYHTTSSGNLNMFYSHCFCTFRISINHRAIPPSSSSLLGLDKCVHQDEKSVKIVFAPQSFNTLSKHFTDALLLTCGRPCITFDTQHMSWPRSLLLSHIKRCQTVIVIFDMLSDCPERQFNSHIRIDVDDKKGSSFLN